MATTPKTMPTNVGGMERMLRVIADDWAHRYYTNSNRIIGLVPAVHPVWN